MNEDHQYCIVNDAAGYAYVNVAKCACSSIKTAIAQHLEKPFHTVQWNKPWRQSSRFLVEDGALYAFTFMRHPAARLVSCWADLIIPPHKDKIVQHNRQAAHMQGWPFEQFAARCCRQRDQEMNPHWAPQTTWLYRRGVLLVDDIYHIETMAEDWKKLQARLGLPELDHLRKSDHRPWQEICTPELRKMIYERYREDFELGGYEA